ncbi:unnamed protein product [Adineta ricciae]|uniref:F-box domain-containing protein n=1 Tax=Adineta ricciae TaxID=249248 RepID=A0A815PR51_ADIRI|nr:unnamed protein product [Adineta ricciae]CAF1452766.1 unnamed protein product [Adineta ricciae]
MESLPDELLLLIFRYLRKPDIICAFSNLNSRFQQIVDPYIHNIDLTPANTVNYKTIRLILDDIVPIYADRIQSLTFDLGRHLSLFRPYVHHFNNLKSLTIESDNTRESHCLYQLNEFLTKVLSLQTLIELSLPSRKEILSTIAYHATPHLSTLSLSQFHGHILTLYMPKMPYIKRSSIALQNANYLRSLFMIMPNLEELSLSLFNVNCYYQGHYPLPVPVSLAKLTVRFGASIEDSYFYRQPYFKWMKDFLTQFKDTVKSLTFIGLYVDNEFIEKDNIQKLVQNFSRLQVFHYDFHTKSKPERCFTNMIKISSANHFINDSPITVLLRSTPNQLYMCNKLKVVNEIFDLEHLLSFYKFKPNYKLRNLREIVCYHDLQDTTSIRNQLISRLIGMSPNLQTISVHYWHDPRLLIKWFKEVSFDRCKTVSNFKYLAQMTFADYCDPRFLYELAKLFPRLKTITFTWFSQTNGNNSTQLTRLIRHLRKYFAHMTYLKFEISSFHFNSQPLFDKHGTMLNELMRQNMTYHTIDRERGHRLLNILL